MRRRWHGVWLTLVACAPQPTGRTWTGHATVELGVSFSGTETFRVVKGSRTLCELTYTVSAPAHQVTTWCEGCEFAFAVDADVGTSTDKSGLWCRQFTPNDHDDSSLFEENKQMLAFAPPGGLGFGVTPYSGVSNSSYNNFEPVVGGSATWDGDTTSGTFTWDWAYSESAYYFYE